jgi:hypothetical protein
MCLKVFEVLVHDYYTITKDYMLFYPSNKILKTRQMNIKMAIIEDANT